MKQVASVKSLSDGKSGDVIPNAPKAREGSNDAGATARRRSGFCRAWPDSRADAGAALGPSHVRLAANVFGMTSGTVILSTLAARSQRRGALFDAEP